MAVEDLQRVQHNNTKTHDARLHELEEHSPEGMGPSGRVVRREVRIILPIVLIGMIATGAILQSLGGWLAVAVGAVLVAGYYAIGWGPVIVAAILRRQEHGQFERIIRDEE